MRIIFHIDMDAFFSAVEEKENPQLKGKPVIVGADPKKGKGRGVVSTCNYNARKYGIRSGMPISFAYRKCPDAVFLPVNMELYWRTSQNIMKIIRMRAVKLQQASVDEAFFITKAATYEEAEDIAKKLKREILEEEGLTCSVGIGPNKLVAKIASDFKKPDGLTVVKPEKVKAFLSPLPARKLYGIGPKTESVLSEMKIKTIGDIADTRKERLAGIFGKWGYRMHDYANGIDDSDIVEESEPKSLGREITFEKDVDFSSLKSIVKGMASEVCKAAKSEGYEFKTVVLKIRFSNFETHTKQKSLKVPADEKAARGMAADTLMHFAGTKKKVRLIGLRLTNLTKIEK